MWHVRVPKGFSRATREGKAWQLRHPPEYTSGPILVSLRELLVQSALAWRHTAGRRARGLVLLKLGATSSQSSAWATAGLHRGVPQNSPRGLAQLLSITDRPRFIVLHRCRVFYKLKARPSTSTKVITRFTATRALLGWSGTEPSIPLRYACICTEAHTDGVSLQIFRKGHSFPYSNIY